MKCLTFAVLVIASLNAANAANKVVCYYSSWAVYYNGKGVVQPEDLAADLCTHVNYAFAEINADGTLKIEDKDLDVTQGGYKRVVAMKQKNPNLKVILSIGGAAVQPTLFAGIAASAAKRAVFVKSARSFLETYHFDGVDIDWEAPNTPDKANFVSLLQDLRTDFTKNGWLITAAVGAIAGPGYDVPKISQLLDFLNIMIYDLYGPWSEYTGQNAALYPSPIESQFEKDNLNMDSSVKQWIKAGAPAQKIIAGLAFYGHSFTLRNTTQHGLHAPITGCGKGGDIVNEAGSISYIEYCLTQKSWTCTWDDTQKVPICLNGNQWLGIDNERSIQEKMNYIKTKGLGGAMIWSIDQDDVHGLCGNANVLLKAVHAGSV